MKQVNAMAQLFIAGGTPTTESFFEKAAAKYQHKIAYLKDKKSLIDEIKSVKPEIFFIHASLLDELSDNIIQQISNEDEIGAIYTVIFGSRNQGEDYSIDLGADNFLSMPFNEDKINAIFRLALHAPKKILFASEKQGQATELLQRLINEECDITHIDNINDALDFAKKQFPDLVLIEDGLSDISAALFCSKLKSLADLKHVNIISLTQNHPDIIGLSLKAGAEKVLTPPFDSDENTQYLLKASYKIKPRKQVVLIVDDSTMVRNIIAKNFKQMGFDITLAKDGEEGLKKLEIITPDIITSDYEMPNMDGWEFCSAVKKMEKFQHIPIIMITSLSTHVDIKKGEVLGVSAYLTKPFKDNELRQTANVVLEEAKKIQEKAALSKYVAEDTLENVAETLSGAKESEPQEKFISILFTDICGFTEKAERLGAKGIIKILNQYFDQMVETLSTHQAIIDKFIGDAIVVRFDSGDKEKDAYQAVTSAIDMLSALNKLNETLEEKLNIRIGINSGNVIMGDIGSTKHRLEYAMIGDNVNIAQRLESQAKPGCCLISEGTYSLIKEKVSVGEEQEIVVKGRRKPVKCYLLELGSIKIS